MSGLRVFSVVECRSHRFDSGRGRHRHCSMVLPTEDGTEWMWYWKNPFVVMDVAPKDLVDLEWLYMYCSRHSNY